MQSDTRDTFQSISSKDNRALKQARKVRDGKTPGSIFIEGRRLFKEAVDSGLEFEALFIEAGFDDDIPGLTRVPADSRYQTSEQLLKGIADTEHPQGIVAIARRPETGREVIEQGLSTSTSAPLVLYLHEINNPSNLGAILRSAEAAGAAGVVVSQRSANTFSPRGLRGAMGSAFRIPVWDGADPVEVMEWAGANGLRTTATSSKGSRRFQDLERGVPRLLMLGSEAQGLSDELMSAADEVTFIPLAGDVESLNIAVAAGVLLFALAGTDQG